MHELALAEAVIVSALEAADRNGLARLTRIEVRVGELQRIRKDTFEFALGELLPASEPRIAGATIEVKIEPVRFRCRVCGRAFGAQDTRGPLDEEESEAIHFIPELAHAFLRCPGCDSPDFEVSGGRGVSIESLEGEA